MYAHLLTCFPGWTWEYIDANMTIPRLKEITAYQKQNPPTHVMIAAYLGIGAEESGTAGSSGYDENGQSLFDLFPTTSAG